MPHVLGIDASTQSCSAIVIDTDSHSIVAEHSINFGERLPQYNSPSGFIPDGVDGEVHADPRMWLDALELLFSELGEQCDLGNISAISGAGQQHGSVYLNSKWFPAVSQLGTDVSLAEQLSPCLSRSTSPIWMDNATAEECAEIAASVGGNDVVCAKSGSIAVERFTGPQIRRFSKLEADAYAATDRIHLVSSFLCSVLVGEDAPIDTGDGAGMNLLNIQSWEWDGDLLDATASGLAAKLPSVAHGNHIVGKVAPYFVDKFGLNPAAEVTIFTGDNPSSLVGMGASSPGKCVISLGTSDTFFAAMPEVVADPAGCGHVFGNPSGGSMSLQCFANGSLAREQVKDKFGYDWDAFTAAFDKTLVGNEGNVMLPFFAAETSPRLANPQPMLAGNPRFCDWQDANAAIRACVEGQCLNMKRSTAWMQLKTNTIYLTGGASKNDAIAQVVADVFQANVQRLAVSSSVGLGAAFRAATNSLGCTLTSLEDAFCTTDGHSTISPKVGPEAYNELAAKVEEILG